MKRLALVLLPGMDGTGLLFEPLLEVLPEDIHPVVVSYPANEPMNYAELLPIVKRSLPKAEPFIVLGESFSGPLALMAAAGGVPNLKAVILCASFIRNPLPYLPRFASRAARPFLFRYARSFILAKALVAGYSTPRLTGLLQKTHGSVSPAAMAARAREILTVDASQELRTCPVPVFYLAGSNDKVVPRKNLRAIKQVREDVKAFHIPGPHLILQTNPAGAARVIREIAESVCAF